MTTTVLIQITNAQGQVIQTQEQAVPDAQAVYSNPAIVAVQTAPTPDSTASVIVGAT